MAMSVGTQPSPALFMQTMLFDAPKPHALGAAIELGMFTAIGEGADTAERIAERCGCAPRGARILCDFLTIAGFLQKEGAHYRLTPDSGVFLDRRSPAYIGDTTLFLLSDERLQRLASIAEHARSGGNQRPNSVLAPDHPAWVHFARGMAPLMRPFAARLAERLGVSSLTSPRVLDISAGHGEYGIAIARANPGAQVVALDWPSVLDVARERAAAAGVLERMQFLPGSAFELDFGGPYDLVLFPNFLHHFDRATIERFLAKVHAALAPSGVAATIEFIPNEDRVTPPNAAAFAIEMLASTPAGDGYTQTELEAMFASAEFARPTFEPVPGAPFTIVIATPPTQSSR